MHVVLLPEGWAKPKGYSNGIVASGETIYLAGQIGWNANNEFETDDLVEQLSQTLRNIRDVLSESGATPEHIVSMTWYLLDKREYLDRLKEMGGAYREVFGKHYPALAAVQVAGLVEDRAKIEIQATAVLPRV